MIKTTHTNNDGYRTVKFTVCCKGVKLTVQVSQFGKDKPSITYPSTIIYDKELAVELGTALQMAANEMDQMQISEKENE